MFTKEELVEIHQVLVRDLYWGKTCDADALEHYAKLEAIEAKTLALIADMNKAEAEEKADREFYYQLHLPGPIVRREDPEQS